MRFLLILSWSQLKFNDTMMRRAASFSITPQNTRVTNPLIIYRENPPTLKGFLYIK